MHTILEVILKRYCFGSINFPLSSASKAKIQPTILLPAHQSLTQCSAHTYITCTLHQGANNIALRSAQYDTKEHITLHQGVHNITPI